MIMITGSIVAIVTPMHEDASLDLEGLRRLVDFHVQEGTDAIVIVGTSKGLFVIEPQDGTIAALKDFPNRNTIESVYF